MEKKLSESEFSALLKIADKLKLSHLPIRLDYADSAKASVGLKKVAEDAKIVKIASNHQNKKPFLLPVEYLKALKSQMFDVTIKEPYINKKGEEDERSIKVKIKGAYLIIPDEIPDNVKTLVEEFKESRYWYKTFKDVMYKTFSDEDGTFLLACLAITSGATALPTNIALAVDYFVAYRHDLKNNRKLLTDFYSFLNDHIQNSEYKAKFTSKKDETPKKYNKLNADFPDNKKFVGLVKNKQTDGEDKRFHKLPLGDIKFYLKLYKNGILKKSSYKTEFEDLWTYKHFSENANQHAPGLHTLTTKLLDYKSGKINKENLINLMKEDLSEFGTLADSPLIGSYKIYNFAISLLTGGESFSIGLNKNVKGAGSDSLDWMPFTIDTHMLKFFYPHLTKDEISAVKSKNFGNVFGVYSYISSIGQKWAKQVGLEPAELQAVLWVAAFNGRNIKNTSKKSDVQDIPYAFEDQITESMEVAIKQFNEDQELYKVTIDTIKKIKKVGQKMKSTYKVGDDIKSTLDSLNK